MSSSPSAASQPVTRTWPSSPVQLAGGVCQACSQCDELIVDRGCEGLHPHSRGQRNECNEERVLDQVLPILFLPKTRQKILHFSVFLSNFFCRPGDMDECRFIP